MATSSERRRCWTNGQAAQPQEDEADGVALLHRNSATKAPEKKLGPEHRQDVPLDAEAALSSKSAGDHGGGAVITSVIME